MTEIDKTILGGGGSIQSNSIDPKISVSSGYSLSTSAQTIVGAINEILPKATGVGKIDSTSDGTGEIFNSYEGYKVNVASGSASHAEGGHTRAEGDYSHAEGSGTTATGDYSHAEGSGTNAKGRYSHAEGAFTHAEGVHSHAEGGFTNAIGSSSHAEGSDTRAEGTNSHTEGTYTQTFSTAEHAEGYSNKSYDSKDPSVRVIHSVGIGSSNSNRKNAHEIKFNGDHYVYGVGGFDGTNSADAQTLQEVINSKQETITAGTGLEMTPERVLNVTLDTTVFKVVSVLPDSPAQGDENKIHLIPAESTGANNAYTEYVWENSTWKNLGEYTSEVDLTPYLKTVDAADTYLAKTDAVGKVDPNSDGTGEIFNYYEGASVNVASGRYSHAEGGSTEATGSYSHAEGECTIANNSGEHAEGSYNLSNTGETDDLRTRHSVGIGSIGDRKNAHEIMANGDHYIYGLGGYDGTNAAAETSQTLQQVIKSLFTTTVDLSGVDKVYSVDGTEFKMVDISDRYYIPGMDIFVKESTNENEMVYKFHTEVKLENLSASIEFTDGTIFEYLQEYRLRSVKSGGDVMIRYGKFSTENENKWWLMGEMIVQVA